MRWRPEAVAAVGGETRFCVARERGEPAAEMGKSELVEAPRRQRHGRDSQPDGRLRGGDDAGRDPGRRVQRQHGGALGAHPHRLGPDLPPEIVAEHLRQPQGGAALGVGARSARREPRQPGDDGFRVHGGRGSSRTRSQDTPVARLPCRGRRPRLRRRSPARPSSSAAGRSRRASSSSSTCGASRASTRSSTRSAPSTTSARSRRPTRPRRRRESGRRAPAARRAARDQGQRRRGGRRDDARDRAHTASRRRGLPRWCGGYGRPARSSSAARTCPR